MDGSIKKNTAFVKKLKAQITTDNLPSLLKELNSLKLEKYLSELIVSISECRLKSTGDAIAAAEICLNLDKRFPGFSEELLEALLKLVIPPPTYSNTLSGEQIEKEEATRLSRVRSIIRLIIELNFIGLCPQKLQGTCLSHILNILVDFFKYVMF